MSKTFRFLLFALLVIASLLLISAALPPSAHADQIVHVVQRGETLAKIAARYGVTVQAIVQANNIRNPNLIYVGQRLLIPTGGTATPTPTQTPGPGPTATPVPTPEPGYAVYYVRAGDTLAKIAARYGVTVQAIVQANNIRNPNLIYVGQRLLIPTGSAVGTPTPGPTTAPGAPSVGFGYGLQAHMIDNDQAPRVMQAVNDLGFGWIKQQVEWKRHEPSKGQYDWGPLDEIANRAQAAGVRVLFSVTTSPRWARRANADFSVDGPPTNAQDLADFMAALAARYRGKVQAYEVWNEPNLHTHWGNEPIDAARYIQLLGAAYRAIKGACPECVVVSAGLTPTGTNDGITAVDDFVYLRRMYNAGLRYVSDAIGAHPSGYNVAPERYASNACEPNFIFKGPCQTPHHSWSFRSTLEGYRSIMVAYGDSRKRIWPTEFGWASNPTPLPHYEYAADNTLEEQAQYTVRAYQMMKNWGWIGVAFLWNLNFKVVAPGSEQAQWGIVDSHWEPLPVYHALKAMPK
jgi:LysM repeat protein